MSTGFIIILNNLFQLPANELNVIQFEEFKVYNTKSQTSVSAKNICIKYSQAPFKFTNIFQYIF